MKKGDVVTITDGSWTRKIKDNKLVIGPGRNAIKQYVIIETGCSFPLYCGMSHQKDKYRSDTVIQAIDSGEVVFIYKNFLHLVPPTHKVMVDIRQDGGWMYGQIVEISDKFYKKIKRDLQTK